MIPASSRSELGNLVSLFVSCATTFVVSVVFLFEERPPYFIDMAVYSAVAFIVSAAFTRYSLRRVPEEGFVARIVLVGVGGGAVTLVSLALT